MKKQKNKIVMNVIIIAVVIGVIALMGFFLTKPISIGGASLLSLDKVSLKSSSPYFSGEAWVLTFSGNPLGQSFYGSWDPDDIEDETSGDLTTKEDFTIEIEYEDTECVYPIDGSSKDSIKDVTYTEWTYVPWVNPCDETEARSRFSGTVVKYGGYGTLWSTCYAVGYSTKSIVKGIDSPDVSADYRITIEAGDESAYEDFSTLDGKTSGPIGSFAYAVWNGNLDSGKSCPSKSNYLGAYVNGNWRVIDEDAYQNYKEAYNNMFSTIGTKVKKDQLHFQISNVQSKASSAKSARSFGTIKNPSSQSNAVIRVTTDTPLQFPVSSIYVKASALGVYTPVPDFKIKSASSECFKTGTQGTINVNLENNGETGGYTAYATCSGFFSGNQNVQGTLSAGSSKTIYIPLSAQASKKEISSCTVYIDSTGKTVSKSVSVCVDPQITCEVDYPKTFCGISQGAEAVMQCSQDGATRNILEVCQSGYACEIKSGEGKCVIDDGGGDGFWDSIVGFFKGIGNFFKGIFDGTVSLLLAIKYFLMVVGGLFALFASKNLLDLVKDLKKLTWVKWLIASAIAIFAGWILYLFIGSFVFWLIMLGLLVYNIFFSQLSVFLNLRKVIKKKR